MFITRGHYRADIDAEDLEHVEISITMSISLETSEALLLEEEKRLNQELKELILMVHDYTAFLKKLHREELEYAV